MKLFAFAIAYLIADAHTLFAALDGNGWAMVIGAIFLGLGQLYTMYLQAQNRKETALVKTDVSNVKTDIANTAIKVNDIAVKTDGLVTKLLASKDETIAAKEEVKDAAVAKAVAETTILAGSPIKSAVSGGELVAAVRDALSTNVETVKKDVKVVKEDVKEVKEKLS